MFDHLPDGCVAHVIEKLHSLQDVINFQTTCSRHAAVGRTHQAAWLLLLRKYFDLRLQGTAPFDGFQLYKNVAKRASRKIRYKGCFTDGGVDEQRMEYWVDHMFSPNHWDSFCSAFGRDVNCAGLLLEQEDKFDKERAIMRSYIIERCSKPVSQFFGAVEVQQIALGEPIPEEFQRFGEEHLRYLKLEAWSTQSLSDLFLSLFLDLQMGTQLGSLLLHATPPGDFPRALNKLQAMANLIQHCHAKTVPALHGSTMGVAYDAVLGTHSVKLMRQACELPRLVGVIERVMISNAGDFSCPLQCGVLFTANCNITRWAHRPSKDSLQILQAFEGTVAQQVCTEFNGVETLQMLCDKVREGRLPMPAAAHLTPNGGWVEFNQSGDPSNSSGESSHPDALMLPTLRPLAWFRFSTAQEHTMLQSHLEAEIEMHGREMEFLHNHELPWWLGDADIHQVADHWRDPAEGMKSFVSSPSDDADVYDPATSTNRLNIRLHHRHAGNMLCVKLINQQNLMEEHQDNHPNPNIDVNFIACQGRLVTLPDQVELTYR